MHKHYIRTAIIIGVLFGGLVYLAYNLRNIPVPVDDQVIDIPAGDYSDLIRISSPKPEEIITATSTSLLQVRHAVIGILRHHSRSL